MANGKITKDQIAEKNTFANISDSAKIAEAQVKALEVTLKAVVETAKIVKSGISGEDPKNNATIKDRNELLEHSNKLLKAKLEAEKLLNKANDNSLKLTKNLIDVEKDSVKQLVDLELKTNNLTASKAALIKKQKQADEQRRAGNEDIAKAIDLTEKEKLRLSELTNEITLANLQKAKSKKLNKSQIEELSGLTDEYQKQSKRLNILRKELKNLLLVEGKSTKQTKKLQKEVTKLDRSLKDVDEAAGQFQRNVGNYPDTLGKAAKAMAVVAAGAISVDAAFSGISTSLNDSAEGSENVREVTSKLGGVFDQVKNVVASAALDLFDYGQGLVEIVNGTRTGFAALGTLKGGFNRVSKATEDFTEKALESADAQAELTKRIIAFEKSSRPLEVRIERLNGLIEQQQIIAGDSTRSFETINSAILKGQDLQVKRSQIVVSLARQELDITQEKIRVAKLSNSANIELLDQETEGIKNLINAENALKNEILENEKELRQVKQDRLEIDLDILIDGFDNQKTINERIIANEKETLEVRGALLAKTAKLAEDSFRGQKEVLEDLSNAGIDVDDLLLLDATELAKQIQLLGQSEIINTRTLEVIRERKIVLQDIKDAQQELNESEQNGIDLRADIAAQEDALYGIIVSNAENTAKEIGKLEKRRTQNEIDSLQRRLNLEEDGSIAALQIQKDLNDALLDQQESRIKNEEKNEEDSNKKNLESEKKAVKLIEDVVIKSIDARIDKLNDEENAHKSTLDEFKQAARDGNIVAKESLAEEKILADEAKNNARKLEQEKQNILLVTAVLKSYVNELENPENNGKSLKAFSKAVLSVGSLQAFAGALPAFLEGTENTGTHGKGIDGKGGFHAVLHPNEKVFKSEHTDMIGDFSNDEVARTMEQKRLGNLIGDTHLIAAANGVDLSGMEAKLDKIERAIIDKPENKIELGAITQESFNIIETRKQGNRTINNRFKVRVN